MQTVRHVFSPVLNVMIIPSYTISVLLRKHVIPAKAGIQDYGKTNLHCKFLDSRFRRNDKVILGHQLFSIHIRADLYAKYYMSCYLVRRETLDSCYGRGAAGQLDSQKRARRPASSMLTI